MSDVSRRPFFNRAGGILKTQTPRHPEILVYPGRIDLWGWLTQEGPHSEKPCFGWKRENFLDVPKKTLGRSLKTRSWVIYTATQ